MYRVLIYRVSSFSIRFRAFDRVQGRRAEVDPVKQDSVIVSWWFCWGRLPGLSCIALLRLTNDKLRVGFCWFALSVSCRPTAYAKTMCSLSVMRSLTTRIRGLSLHVRTLWCFHLFSCLQITCLLSLWPIRFVVSQFHSFTFKLIWCKDFEAEYSLVVCCILRIAVIDPATSRHLLSTASESLLQLLSPWIGPHFFR